MRGGGIVVPVLTTVLAFFVGGLVILVTGHNPLSTYKAIFNGTGLNWFFPWIVGRRAHDGGAQPAADADHHHAADPHRARGGLRLPRGLFNIGGQGQYLVGAYRRPCGSARRSTACRGCLHIVLAIVAAALAGAVWAGIAGLLKATVGAHEVISTIMLNWIAVWVGSLPLRAQRPAAELRPAAAVGPGVQRRRRRAPSCPVFWGDPELQGLHIGLFIALAAVVVYWVLLNRSTTGYEVRAVGFNPEAARYGGISVARNYILVMAVCGAFAGLAGSMDVLGWEFHIATNDIQLASAPASASSASRSRCSGATRPSGTLAAALLFGALLSGTSQRNLDPTIFEPELASNLTAHHPGARRADRQRRRDRADDAAPRARRSSRRAAGAPPCPRRRPRRA